MAFTYVRYPPLSVFRSDEHTTTDFTVFDLALEKYPMLPIGDRFRRLDPALRSGVRYLFRGADESLLDHLRKDVVLHKQLSDRQVGAIVCSGNQVKLFSVTGFTEVTPEPSMEIIREMELKSILSYTGGVFRGPDDHFTLPSGAHADAFLDLGPCSLIR